MTTTYIVTAEEAQNTITNYHRRILCLPLPSEALAQFDETLTKRITSRIQNRFHIQEVTPVLREIDPELHTLAFFHPAPRQQCIATYEEGQLTMSSYTPRQAFVVTVDQAHKMFYVSTPDDSGMLTFLSTLNGTLFPSRPHNKHFQAYTFDIDLLPLLTHDMRHPHASHYPWKNLILKSLQYDDSSHELLSTKLEWGKDGFEAFELKDLEWPRRVQSVSLNYKPHTCSKYFSATFTHQDCTIRATISERTIDSVAGLVHFLSHEGALTTDLNEY